MPATSAVFRSDVIGTFVGVGGLVAVGRSAVAVMSVSFSCRTWVRSGELPDSRPLPGGFSGTGRAAPVARGRGRGWSLPAGGGGGDAVQEAVKSPEVLLGGYVTGPDGGRCRGSGIAVGRCRGEG